jgi:hypothetical protein
VVSSVATPGCGDATGTGPRLPAGLTHLSTVPGNPFGVAVTADGRWSFVSLLSGGGIAVFADTGSGGPRLVRTVAVSGAAAGLTVTPDDRYLLAADGGGAAVISVQAAEEGHGKAVMGTLASPGGAAGAAGAAGAIEVAVSPAGDGFPVTATRNGERLGPALSDGAWPRAMAPSARAGRGRCPWAGRARVRGLRGPGRR